MKSETRRLNKLKDESRNPAKRYRLTEAAVEAIRRAGKVYSQESRAIQVAVELLWHSIGEGVSDETMAKFLDSPLTGKTYRLPPLTIFHIEDLSHEYGGTLGNVMAAVACMLSQPDPRSALSKMPVPPPLKIVYEPGETAETMARRVEQEIRALTKAKRKPRK